MKKVSVEFTGEAWRPLVEISFLYGPLRIEFKFENIRMFSLADIKTFQAADQGELIFGQTYGVVGMTKRDNEITIECNRTENTLKLTLPAVECDVLLELLARKLHKSDLNEIAPYMYGEEDHVYFAVLEVLQPAIGYYYQGRKALPMKLIGLNKSHIPKLRKMLAGEVVTLIAPDVLMRNSDEMSPTLHGGTQLRTDGRYLIHGVMPQQVVGLHTQAFELKNCLQFLEQLIKFLEEWGK